MYKCKECGLEYNEKPDYCDCGNDEFEVGSVKAEPVKPVAQIESPKEQSLKTEMHTKNRDAGNTVVIKQTKKTFSEQYPALSRFLNSIDPISGGIFILCLFLSFYVIYFAWNVDETKIIESPAQSAVTDKNIPSIDKFWNNAIPVSQETTAETQKNEPPKIIEEVKSFIQPAAKPAAAQKTVSKQVSQTKTTQKQTVIKQKTSADAGKTTQKQAAMLKPVENKPQTIQKTEPVQNVQTAVSQKSDAEIAAEKAAQARQEAQAKIEFANYKTALRNTIGRKIDFTKVVGDGSCTVAFKIDSSGKLVNRSFAKQSSNITLNDAVYAAVMSTPSYNPTPSAYKNETLNLSISFYNGNFEISLR